MTVAGHEADQGQEAPREWQTRNMALIDAFLHAEPDAAEPVRLAHCQVCRATAAEGATAASRLLVCNQWRCGLRDPEHFRAEQDWAAAIGHQLNDPAGVADQVLANFNLHVAAAGCATVGLVRGPDGIPTLGVNTPTLRARLHALLAGWFTAKHGGIEQEKPPPVGEAHAVLRGQRESRREWQKRRAAALRAEGVSDNQIAQRLRVDPKMLRIWLGNRGAG